MTLFGSPSVTCSPKKDPGKITWGSDGRPTIEDRISSIVGESGLLSLVTSVCKLDKRQVSHSEKLDGLQVLLLLLQKLFQCLFGTLDSSERKGIEGLCDDDSDALSLISIIESSGVGSGDRRTLTNRHVAPSRQKLPCSPFLAERPNKDQFLALERRVEIDPKEVIERIRREKEAAEYQRNVEERERGADFEEFAKICSGQMSLNINSGPTIWTKKQGKVGIATTQGKRSLQEDTFLVDEFSFGNESDKRDVFIAGVIDGHGAKTKAESKAPGYVRDHIVSAFKKSLNRENKNGASLLNIWNAFKLTNPDYLANKFTGTDGAVGNFCFFFKDDNGRDVLAVVNTGDCRAVFVGNKVIQLSEDQKPGDPKYDRGIKKRGQSITQEEGDVPRVAHELSVARVIVGDRYKTSARPKVTYYDVEKELGPGIVFIYSDGVSEVAATNQAGIFFKLLQQTYPNLSSPEQVDILAHLMVRAVLQAGSEDNITVAAIPIG